MIKFKEDTHQYFNEDHKELISVTTLMKKHGLSPDYSKVKKTVLKSKAERGSLIHKEIEDYNKLGDIGFTKEFMNFKEYLDASNVKVLDSEFMVYNDIVAGCVDLLLDENGEPVIADIKTTSSLHKDSVSWQLSIYAYLSGKDIKKGQAFHFKKNGELDVVNIPLKPMSEIERLMDCERKGVLFEPTRALTVKENELLNQLSEIERVIAYHESIKKEADKRAVEVRQAIIRSMEENNIKSFENENIKITYVAPIKKLVIDSAKLKKEKPEIVKDYSKESEVKASIRITLKEEK